MRSMDGIVEGVRVFLRGLCCRYVGLGRGRGGWGGEGRRCKRVWLGFREGRGVGVDESYS